MIYPKEHRVYIRGIWLRYVDWGNSGPPLLLLHGDMRTGRSWDGAARDLCCKFRVTALDARGHGDSDWPEKGYRYDDRIEELAAFCHEIGFREAIGVGHSSGAAVVALTAHRYPGLFSRLVLLEPVVMMTEAFQRRISARAERPRRTWASRQELLEHLKQHNLAGRWRDDVIQDVVKHEAMELPDGRIDMKWATRNMHWEEREGDYFDLKPVFRSLGVPILLVTSSERKSSYDDLKSMQADVPGFSMLEIKDTGHNMYMERPDAVAQAIEAFAEGRELPDAL